MVSASRPPNLILRALGKADFDRLSSSLEEHRLEARVLIEAPNQPIEYVHFPTSGIISIVAKATGDRRIEAGLIGREGMTGLAVVMANHRSPHEAYAQVDGVTMRAPADSIRALAQESEAARSLFLRFANVFMVQATHTALANGRAKIDERLARWLLMAHDRLDGDEIPLTHEFLALMLGVRRPGVTDALHDLEGQGIIRSERGRVELLDRKALLKCAGASYGVPEAEYERLIGGA